MGTGSIFKVKWLPGHLLVVVAVLVCLRLGWWQWDRTREADGTLQNFAYAILWPAFGASFIYMWWRFLSLEASREAEDDRELDEDLALMSEQEETDRADRAELLALQASAAPDTAPLPSADEPDVIEPTDDADREGWFVGTVEEADEDSDPELAAYNRALAALAEEDRRRAG
ncbi:MAG: hypothetical protein WKF57_13995 [Nakamurella sp.]